MLLLLRVFICFISCDLVASQVDFKKTMRSTPYSYTEIEIQQIVSESHPELITIPVVQSARPEALVENLHQNERDRYSYFQACCNCIGNECTFVTNNCCHCSDCCKSIVDNSRVACNVISSAICCTGCVVPTAVCVCASTCAACVTFPCFVCTTACCISFMLDDE